MNEKWMDIFDELLMILYHGMKPDIEGSWVKEYLYEIKNMKDDIIDFHDTVTKAGYEVSNEAMADFLLYVESIHICNSHIVNKEPVNMDALFCVAAKINDELN